MSYYTNQIKSVIVDAQFNQSLQRSEFRLDLPDTMYSSDLRIHGLGCVVSPVTSQTGVRYNLLSGAHGIVRSMTLYSGSIVLDQIVSFADWAGIMAYKHTNNQNVDGRTLSKGGLGFIYHKGLPVATVQLPPVIKESCPDMGVQLGQDALNTPTGMVYLKQIFPLLGQLPFLHTSLFPQLRVVIEYNNPKQTPFIALPNPLGANTVTETTQPILCADVILNTKFAEETLNKFTSVIWNAIELDSVVVPTDSTGGKQRLQGFTNKTLTSLTIQKKPQEQGSAVYLQTCSQFVFDERCQLYLNGSALQAESGVERPSQRLQQLTDVHGIFNAIPCGANGSVYGAGDLIDNAAQRVSKLDYYAAQINQRVTSLDVDFSRRVVIIEGVNTEQYNQRLVLNCWGMVKKAIVKGKGNTFSVIYV
jgi:hypothetical protein